ncbi:MAG: hypothetical protein HRT80_06590 [Henriciella sp.]|nr:hypothetical protein [Henriciella sp.]
MAPEDYFMRHLTYGLTIMHLPHFSYLSACIAPIMGGFSFLRWAMGEEPVRIKAQAIDAQIRLELVNGYTSGLIAMGRPQKFPSVFGTEITFSASRKSSICAIEEGRPRLRPANASKGNIFFWRSSCAFNPNKIVTQDLRLFGATRMNQEIRDCFSDSRGC